MNRRVLDWLACPICGELYELDEQGTPTETVNVEPSGDVAEVIDGTLTCSNAHSFPVVDGVPRLLLEGELESGDARSIRESFSRQWEHYDYDAQDKTWGLTLESRTLDFPPMVDHRPDELAGKLVLDAGCGNGLLSDAITGFGCEVVAADLSSSVDFAFRRFGANPSLHFVQADLMNSPFRPGAFNIVFCGGVLIVTPDSKATFEKVAAAVAPGGKLFVWVYWKEPTARYRFKVLLRRASAPLPLSAKRGIAYAFVPQALARQWFRKKRAGDQFEGEYLNWREHFVVQHDFFTPQYRWEHTPEEVHQWYRELGFEGVKTTEEVAAGFGVVGTRPVDSGTAEPRTSHAARGASHA